MHDQPIIGTAAKSIVAPSRTRVSTADPPPQGRERKSRRRVATWSARSSSPRQTAGLPQNPSNSPTVVCQRRRTADADATMARPTRPKIRSEEDVAQGAVGVVARRRGGCGAVEAPERWCCPLVAAIVVHFTFSCPVHCFADAAFLWWFTILFCRYSLLFPILYSLFDFRRAKFASQSWYAGMSSNFKHNCNHETRASPGLSGTQNKRPSSSQSNTTRERFEKPV
jgi:hypothetical protein